MLQYSSSNENDSVVFLREEAKLWYVQVELAQENLNKFIMEAATHPGGCTAPRRSG